MTENVKKVKDKMAHLHVKVLSLRVRRIPRKLAWFIVPEMVIFAMAAHLFGVAAFAWLISAQILVWPSFMVISALTRPAYRWYMDDNRNQEQKSKSDGYQNNSANTSSAHAHSEYHSNNQQQSSGQQHNDKQQHNESHYKSSQQQNSSQQQDYNWQQKANQRQSNSQDRSNSQQSSDRQQNSGQYKNNSHQQGNSQQNGSLSVDEAKKLFGLNGSFTAEELKKAFRRELKKNHPDQNVNSTNTKKYEDITKKINMAYTLLKGMCTN